MKVLGPPGTEKKNIFEDLSNIKQVGNNYTDDNGHTWKTLEPPANLSSSRIKIKYNEEGGKDKDGVIEIRRGLDDLNLGNSQYAQVRIAVDGTHYLKGMAMYSDDMPEGVDVVFNTNKPKGTPMLGPKDNTVLKPLKNDPDNPFGALIKENKYDKDGNLLRASGQYHYIGKDGKEHLSPINKVKEEKVPELDPKALFKIGYGLYVVTSNDGKKDNGLILNSVTQVTNTPNRVAVTINKDNYSVNHINLDPVLLTTHDGIVFDNSKEEMVYTFQRNDEFTYNEPNTDIYCIYNLWLKNRMQCFERAIKKYRMLYQKLVGLHKVLLMLLFS